jgi:hypothetical protein
MEQDCIQSLFLRYRKSAEYPVLQRRKNACEENAKKIKKVVDI